MKKAESKNQGKEIIKKYNNNIKEGKIDELRKKASEFIEQQQLKKEKFRQLVTKRQTPYKTIQAQCQAICQEMGQKDINKIVNKIVKCYFSDPLVDQGNLYIDKIEKNDQKSCETIQFKESKERDKDTGFKDTLDQICNHIVTDYAFARNAEITISGGTFEEQLKAMQSLEKNGILHATIQYPNTPFPPPNNSLWKDYTTLKNTLEQPNNDRSLFQKWGLNTVKT